MTASRTARTFAGALSAALLVSFVAASPAAAQDAATCTPACGAGQLCVQGTCMIPAPAPTPTITPAPAAPEPPPNYYPAPAQQPGGYPTPPGAYYPPPSSPPGYPTPQSAPYSPPPSGGYPPPPSGYYPPPPSGYPPPPPPPPLHRSGFLALPFVGLNSFAGDSGQDLGVGLRLGTLLGGRINEGFSLNGEIVIDFLNPQNLQSGTDLTAVEAALTLSPLFHVPSGPVELVLGPKLGFWGGSSELSSGGTSISKSSASGYVFGLNAGLFGAVSNTMSIGGLIAFDVRTVHQQCTTPAGFSESCMTSNLPDSDKVFGFNGAILF